MTEQYSYDVFISYSHADSVWVRGELLARLEAAGLRVCIDQRDFAIGVPIPISIEQAIATSRQTVVVLSPPWVAGEWTEFESLLLSSADPAARKRKLMPLLLQPCNLPQRISTLGYADLTQPEQYEFQFNRLVQQLRQHGQTSPAPVPPSNDATPFVAGPPIMQPRRFFGRQRELRRLFNLLSGSPLQNAAIIGQRRSGKSSLLQYLKAIPTTPADQLRPSQRNDWLPQPERYRWVFVDFQDTRLGTQEGLLRHMLTSLNLPIPDRCDLAQHMGRSSPFFNIFGYTATLGPLTEPEARDLIGSSPLPFSADGIAWILAQSGRWPILLHILCRERLLALEDGEDDATWQAEGLRQITPFRGLLGE